MNTAKNTASVALTAADALLNGGTLVIYAGTMPATPETALASNTALVTFTFAATAFGTPTFASNSEQATASFVSNSVAPAASGTATFARSYKSDGATVVADYTVGTSGTDIVLGTTAIQTGTNVTLSSFLETMPAV